MDEAPAPLGSSTSQQESEGDQHHHADAVDGKVHIDTTAPIDSVKGAVSKFGGILDWRERRKQVQDELDKVQEEVADYQKRSQEAAAGMARAAQELGGANGAIDELRLSLEKAQAEEARARQDTELAELRLRETQQGVRESTAAKAELAVARDRHATAIADLRSVKAELELLRKEHAAAAAEADAAAARARVTVSSSQEAVKAVEELTAELVAVKEEVEACHLAHDEAEEKRMRVAMALEQEKVQWRRELELAEQEVKKLADSLMATKDLESKVAAASETLVGLRAELFARAVEGTIGEEAATEKEKPTVSSRAKLDKTKKELEDVKATVDKAKDEAKCLRVAAASLSADLEKQKAELAALRRREGLSATSIPALEEELSRVTTGLTAAQVARAKDGGVETKMPAQLEEARREAEKAKAKARSAQEAVSKAREEAVLAKAAVHTMEARLEAVKREILAATTSEGIAAASAAALLQEGKPARNAQLQEDVEGSVTLTAEEYDELSRRARETEEDAGKRVTEAVKQIKEAKDAEVRSLDKLAQLAKQTEQRRQALEAASAEAEEAEFGKLAAERELRQWRAEHEHQRRLAGETASPRTGLAEVSVFDDASGGGNPHILSPRGGYMPRTEMAAAAAEAEGAKQKSTFFPRMVMFLARKRAQNWK
ncbi:protein WEAK CHLOROPLAST MOVEMENT UNDER BLUE LIGHT 1-like [Oryza brachyantha]|uniref:Protein WEAK CHLOROPLAST MOVEMENT UNDER BLUE LIGHT 1 n=1 Tax=Oryza brachyantha TaxID=4533 RepID=J3LJ54_ORYBR|nr:protein WEAK CHLOROPLAST MOVEMENT UNDER BLUE LIGHT 1-like [Oryza brachyantha]